MVWTAARVSTTASDRTHCRLHQNMLYGNVSESVVRMPLPVRKFYLVFYLKSLHAYSITARNIIL
jgi:hypothetical protein